MKSPRKFQALKNWVKIILALGYVWGMVWPWITHQPNWRFPVEVTLVVVVLDVLILLAFHLISFDQLKAEFKMLLSIIWKYVNRNGTRVEFLFIIVSILSLAAVSTIVVLTNHLKLIPPPPTKQVEVLPPADVAPANEAGGRPWLRHNWSTLPELAGGYESRMAMMAMDSVPGFMLISLKAPAHGRRK